MFHLEVIRKTVATSALSYARFIGAVAPSLIFFYIAFIESFYSLLSHIVVASLKRWVCQGLLERMEGLSFLSVDLLVLVHI